MSSKITILGSGTGVPRLERSSCAVLLETGPAKIVMDLGPGTLRRLLRCGVTIFDVTHICLSHFHPDHSAELVPLLFATKYPDNTRRQNRLSILGGQGLDDFYTRLQGAYGDWIVLPPEQVRFRELARGGRETVDFEAFRLAVRSMKHRPESLAFRIETPSGRSIVYSGDTDPCDALVELAAGVDLLICESSMPDGRKAPMHLTPSLAGDVARRAGVGMLVLTHFYPPCEEVDVVKQARSVYKGEVVAAEDLITFELH
jgi:ribonuclease BN (tRNA processing enzyme)